MSEDKHAHRFGVLCLCALVDGPKELGTLNQSRALGDLSHLHERSHTVRFVPKCVGDVMRHRAILDLSLAKMSIRHCPGVSIPHI